MAGSKGVELVRRRATVARLRAERDASFDAKYVVRAVRDANDGIVDLEYLEVNRRGAERLCVPLETIVGRKVSELYPRWIADGLLDDVRRALSTGEAFESDAPLRLPHHERPRWMRRQYLPIGDDEIAIVSRDVTQEREMERSLLRDFDRVQRIVALQSELLAADIEPERLIDLVVERARELCRATGASFVRREDETMVHGSAAGTAAAHVGLDLGVKGSLSAESARAGVTLQCTDSETDPRVNVEACRRVGARSILVVPFAHEGRVHGVLKVYAPTPNAFDGGDVAALQLLGGFVNTILDRAKARHARNAADEARMRFAAIVESSPDAIFEVDTAGIVVSWSPGAERTYGWPRGEILGRGIDVVVPPESARDLEQLLPRAIAGEALTNLESVAMRRDGTRFPVSFSCSPLRDAAGRITGIAAIARDVGDQKRMQRDLAQAQRMSALGTMTAGIAHEINSPLTAASANVAVALDEIAALRGALSTKADESTLRALDEVHVALVDANAGAERVTAIVQDMRAFSAPEATPRARVDLTVVVAEALRTAWGGSEPRARIVQDFQGSPEVRADARQLVRALCNLLVNAEQAVERCAPERRRIDLKLSTASDGAALIEISDHGVGISQETMARIFEPFFTTRDVGRGTGMGLAVVHTIVSAHGGTVSVTSELGEGTTVTVRLPAATTITGTPKKREQNARVLVIDDEPMIGAAIQRALRREAEVVFADGAEEADRILRATRDDGFDLVLCDVMMPGTSGIDFFHRVRDARPKLAERFVFLTGGAFTEQSRTFLSSMADRFVAKPFRAEELRKLLAEKI